jgi:hypothetical protein
VEVDVKKETEASRLLHDVFYIVHNSKCDLTRYSDLPRMVWAGFEEFKRAYQRLNRDKGDTSVTTTILARPLIGSRTGYLPDSPISPGDYPPEVIQRHLHLFLQYVSLLKYHHQATEERSIGITEYALTDSEATHQCHLIVPTEGPVDFPTETNSSIKLQTVREPKELIAELQNKKVSWPAESELPVTNIERIEINYGESYFNACQSIDKEIFNKLPEDARLSLAAAWLYLAKASVASGNVALLIIRGIDPRDPSYHPDYPWGGIWFLLDRVPSKDQVYAMSLLVHEVFDDAAIEVAARELGAWEERKKDLELFELIKEPLGELSNASHKCMETFLG